MWFKNLVLVIELL